MEELIDELNEAGSKIGTITKDEAHAKGILHRVVHVWIINDKNQILVQKRAPLKDFYPNVWDVSFAGHVKAGESSLEAVLREGKEELGIDVDENDLEYAFTFLDKLYYKDIVSNEFADVYVLRKNIDISNLKLQSEELEQVMWLPLSRFFVLCYSNKFLPHIEGYKRLKDYLS